MKVFGISDQGLCRRQNQDSFYYSVEPCGKLSTLFLVADGMGGHLAGEVASKYTVEHIPDYIKYSKEKDVNEILGDAIQKVNTDIFTLSAANAEYNGMGTTLVAATIQKQILYIANVGDSRAYHFQDGSLKQITRDHSWVEELVQRGEIERGGIFYQRNKNVITRVIGGIREQAQPEFFQCMLKNKDIILMCSDGLTNMVSDERIECVLKQDISIEEKVDILVRESNENGGLDNITVLLIQIESEVSR